MKRVLKRLLPLCLAVLLLGQLLTLTACKKDNAGGDPIPYTVTVRTQGGMALEGIEIFIYNDSSKADLIWAGKTDANGVLSFSAPEKDGYIATLNGVPAGYAAEESYPLTGADTVISLAAKMATDVDMSTITVKQGDVMFDFTVTDTDGNKHTLSELLKTKQAVVLNFWYTNCGPCKLEFPYLQEAYTKYSDKIEVLAMNPIDSDTAAVATFKSDLKLTFPMAVVDKNWERIFNVQGYPTTVVIDRYGSVGLIHTGMLNSAADFEEIFSHYADANYTQGGDTSDLIAGSTGNKLEFGGVQEFDVKVPADTQIPVDLYKVMNMILEIKSPNVYVVYGGETFTPVNGVLTLPVSAPDTMTAVSLMIGNSGKAEETFHATLSMPQGSMGNALTMKLGEFTASVEAGNNQGVFYTYTAEKTGELTVTCLGATAGVTYGYTLYNLSTYAYKSLESDGKKDAAGNPILTIAVRKGDQVQFSASSLPDDKNEYPAATFKFKAAFEEKDVVINTQKKGTTYTLTLKDNTGKAVSGATFTAMTDGAVKTFSTNKDGVATIDLEYATCVFVLTVPKGYTATVTTVRLTAEKPSTTLTVIPKVVKNIVYTATVTDKDGKAVAGATVAIGNQYALTDKDGKVSITLPEGIYDVLVSPPAGYAIPAAIKVTAAAPNAAITLQAGSASAPTGDKAYSVKVTDAAGTAQSGVMVKFVKQDGTAATLLAVDANGIAKVTLPAADYKVELVFGATAKGYDRAAAKVTASAPDLTVIVADGVSGTPIEVYGGTIMAEPVRLGGTYVELLANATADNPNYFVFTPAETGLYQFTTTNPKAVITNWGGNPQYLYNSTEYTGTNTFTVNVKDMGDEYHQFIGVHGATEAVVLVTRLGDAELGLDDMPYDTYKTTATLKKFQKPSGTVSYIDVTKAQTVVLGSDGFYHLGSASGPKLYVNLGETSPYLSIADVAANGGMKDYVYDDKGNFVKKEEYNSCIYQYYGYTDNTTNQWVEGYTDNGFYPLTADLMYILQTHTKFYGWSDQNSKNYLFTGKTVNVDSAWLFCVCTIG